MEELEFVKCGRRNKMAIVKFLGKWVFSIRSYRFI